MYTHRGRGAARSLATSRRDTQRTRRGGQSGSFRSSSERLAVPHGPCTDTCAHSRIRGQRALAACMTARIRAAVPVQALLARERRTRALGRALANVAPCRGPRSPAHSSPRAARRSPPHARVRARRSPREADARPAARGVHAPQRSSRRRNALLDVRETEAFRHRADGASRERAVALPSGGQLSFASRIRWSAGLLEIPGCYTFLANNKSSV